MARDLESANEMMAETLFRSLPGLVGVVDLSGTLLRANAELSTLIEKLEVPGTNDFFRLFPAALRPALAENLLGAELSPALFDLELLVDGRGIHCRWQARRLAKLSPESESRFLLVGTPIDDLRSSARLLENLGSSLPLGLLIVDRSFKIERAVTACSQDLLRAVRLEGENVIDAVFKRGWDKLSEKERLAVDGLGDFFGGDCDRFELLIEFFPKLLVLPAATVAGEPADGASGEQHLSVAISPIYEYDEVERLIFRFEKIKVDPNAKLRAQADGLTEIPGPSRAVASLTADFALRRIEEIKACPEKLIFLAEKELGAFAIRIENVIRKKDARAMLSQLHGLKGTARLVGLVSIGDQVHELETLLASEPERQAFMSGTYDPQLRCLLAELDETRKLYGVVHGKKVSFNGKDSLDRQHGSVQQLFANFNQLMMIKPGLGSAVASARIDWAIRSAERVSIAELQELFVKHIGSAAVETEKQVSVNWLCEAMPIDEESRKILTQVLTHLATNAVAHGIETPAARVKAGKPPVGTVRAVIHYDGTHLQGAIGDDGCGVDPQAVRASALKKGFRTKEQLARLSDKDAIALLFEPGFSTADEVTKLSGRGVGLDAVKTALKKLGGDVRIDSAIGLGSTFSFWLSPPSIRVAKKRFITYRALHGQFAQAARFQVEHEGLSVNVVDAIENASNRETGLMHIDDIQLLMAVTGLVGIYASTGTVEVAMKVVASGDVTFEVKKTGSHEAQLNLPAQYAILQDSFDVWIRVNGGTVVKTSDQTLLISVGGSIVTEKLPVLVIRAAADLQVEDYEMLLASIARAASAMGFEVERAEKNPPLAQADSEERQIGKLYFTAAYATYEPMPGEVVIRYRQSTAEIKPMIMAAMEKATRFSP
jgi:signal transduction histidine kinase